jgi:hypothetical protein
MEILTRLVSETYLIAKRLLLHRNDHVYHSCIRCLFQLYIYPVQNLKITMP